jgi:Uma2 family endonuclease
MATVSSSPAPDAAATAAGYPTSDGRPMGETDLHRSVMIDVIETLQRHFRDQMVYVSGNLLLYYRPGNKRRHVAPDVLVTKGLENRMRDCYLLWEEKLPPSVVIEVTSASTRDEDLEDKFEVYRDEVQVREYFLFDPRSEYLQPPLQGHRLVGGQYVPIQPVDGRLSSEELGLHLEVRGQELRFYNPATQQEELARLERELKQLRSQGGKP